VHLFMQPESQGLIVTASESRSALLHRAWSVANRSVWTADQPKQGTKIMGLWDEWEDRRVGEVALVCRGGN
jgi:hypothetical protein